jgi:hypothetical protein
MREAKGVILNGGLQSTEWAFFLHDLVIGPQQMFNELICFWVSQEPSL